MKERLIALWESGKIQDYIKDNREILLKVAAAALLVAAAFFVFVLTGDEEESLAEETNVVTEAEPKMTMIMVDIGGAVNDPMVAELEEGSRVEDAINAAGGVTEDADLTEINRAAFLEDGDKILIPEKQEVALNDISNATDGSAKGGYTSYSDGKININTAGSEELQTLDGVGPVTAEKIIDYRESNGRFKDIEDIKNVSGIGEKTFEKLKDDIRT
ncbi:MAG: helix-hairpin-helix domain-containing protein [Firmicutes bacterium]|nr:helix-hairpin-helix domain-containing protein [Bacillota bacterium]